MPRKVKDLLLPVLPSAKIDGYVIANPLSGTAFGVAVPDVEIVVLSQVTAVRRQSGNMGPWVYDGVRRGHLQLERPHRSGRAC